MCRVVKQVVIKPLLWYNTTMYGIMATLVKTRATTTNDDGVNVQIVTPLGTYNIVWATLDPFMWATLVDWLLVQTTWHV